MHSPKVECDLVASKQYLGLQLSVVGCLLLHLLWQSHLFFVSVVSLCFLLFYSFWLVACFFFYKPQRLEFVCEQAQFSIRVKINDTSPIIVQRVFMTPWFCVFLGRGRQRYLLWFDQINSQKKWALSKQLQYWRQNSLG